VNPLVKSYLQQIDHAIDDLHHAFDDIRTQLNAHREARDKSLKESWNLKKEASVLRDALQGHEELQTDNQRLHEAYSDIEDRLRRLLKFTDALANEFRQ